MLFIRALEPSSIGRSTRVLIYQLVSPFKYCLPRTSTFKQMSYLGTVPLYRCVLNLVLNLVFSRERCTRPYPDTLYSSKTKIGRNANRYTLLSSVYSRSGRLVLICCSGPPPPTPPSNIPDLRWEGRFCTGY